MSISNEKLDFWIANKYNVLLVGKHGVGKTTAVLQAFERAGLRWMYYSASTMDPWVDMIGVPKEKTDENGMTYLDLVRPREFQNDEIEALFFDEFNRSHKKIRNAVMELIQFKSINGRKFNNLKMVWAAINPADEAATYDVDALDPAQEDRFHVKVEVPYRPSAPYFETKYGRESARAAIEWWNALDGKIKDLVSPRRLDYALKVYTDGGDMRDCLPHTSNITKLVQALQFGPIKDRLEELVKSTAEARAEWLLKENNFNAAKDMITKPGQWMESFIPCLSDEKLSSLASKNRDVRNFVLRAHRLHENMQRILTEVVKADQNRAFIREIRGAAPDIYSAVTGKEVRNGVLRSVSKLGENPLMGDPAKMKDQHPSFVVNVDALYRKAIGGQLDNTYRRREAVETLYACRQKVIAPDYARKILVIMASVGTSFQAKSVVRMEGKFFSVFNQALACLYGVGEDWNKVAEHPLVKPFMRSFINYRLDKNPHLASRVLTTTSTSVKMF